MTKLEEELHAPREGLAEARAASAASMGSTSAQTRERESLLKLVNGMACGGYGYMPTASRSSVPGEIAGDLQRLGIGLSDVTILKYLREGAKLLPRDEAK